jgi:hypothetical protein
MYLLMSDRFTWWSIHKRKIGDIYNRCELTVWLFYTYMEDISVKRKIDIISFFSGNLVGERYNERIGANCLIFSVWVKCLVLQYRYKASNHPWELFVGVRTYIWKQECRDACYICNIRKYPLVAGEDFCSRWRGLSCRGIPWWLVRGLSLSGPWAGLMVYILAYLHIIPG